MSKKVLLVKDITSRYENYESAISTNLLREIHSLFLEAHINLKERNRSVYVVNSRMNRGFIIKCKKLASLEINWEHLCFYFMNLLLHHQYTVHYCFMTEGSGLSAFLQPEMKLRAQNPVKQLFGNIFIDFSGQKNDSQELRILNNIYSGYNYQKPLEFELLIDLLFLKKIKKNL